MRMENRTFVLSFSDMHANRNGSDPVGNPNLTRFLTASKLFKLCKDFVELTARGRAS
ncbi:hypothetical protein HDF14_004008 [Edaphobacter lichenicola]|jgi:hypothetical protein|uniref:Uncharacterized protein n=1 Tax=Tunturiibacter gelidiferens TaxID=3069689 RepID=A0A9X0QHL7_9BACT|nr:hypothetical protein [Edaphobacter lichenicola]